MSLLSDGLDDGEEGDNETLGALTLSNVNTNAQAKNALGVATNYLAKAYAVAEKLSGNLRVQALDLLDRNRKYVEGLYRNLPLNNDPVSSVNAKKIKTALQQSESNISLINSVDSTMRQSFLKDVADTLKTKLSSIVPNLPSGSSLLGTTLKIVGGVVVVGGLGWYFLHRAERKVIEHVTADDGQ